MRETIEVKPSPTADTRTCDFANVTRQTLYDSSVQHIQDVRRGLEFFERLLSEAALRHDTDKLTDIDGFHADFVTGFKQTGWWDRHRKLNRHHLFQADGVPDDVNLIDVLDLIADCVMAGMARSGSVTPLLIDPAVLMRAFENTAELLKAHVVLVLPVVGPDQKPAPHPFYGDSWERGKDPFHAQAFERIPGIEGRVGTIGPRRDGWFLIDGAGNAIGFIPDGSPVQWEGVP